MGGKGSEGQLPSHTCVDSKGAQISTCHAKCVHTSYNPRVVTRYLQL